MYSYIRAFGQLTSALNSSVNVFIYAVMNKRFRYAYKILLKCTCKSVNQEMAVHTSQFK